MTTSEIQSRREVKFKKALNQELEYKSPTFGSAELDGTSFVASIADEVVAISLPRMFEKRGVAIPAEYALYGKSYDLWLVPHRVGILRKAGLREVTSVVVEARFETERKTCAIVSLLPQSKFVRVGGLSFEACVDINGRSSTPSSSVAMEPIPGMGLSAGIVAGVNASLAFEAAVLTPVIQAIGEGTREARWVFEQDKRPLYGSDVAMWSVLLLPRLPLMKKITYKLRAHITHRVFVFPTVWSSPQTTVNCTLIRD
jgi:hypothetical protein